MIGIINSELNPSELSNNVLFKALKEHEFLISLMQKACFDELNYNPDNDLYQDVTPRQFKVVVNAAMQKLEHDIWTALENYAKTVDKELNLPKK